MANCIERKCTPVSKIPKSVCCCYDDNFKLMIIKLVQEINIFATAWKFCVTEWNVWCWRKTICKGENSTWNALHVLKQVISVPLKKVVEFALIIVCKNDFPIQMKALEVPTFLKIPLHDFKPNNGWALKFLCLEGLVLCQRTTVV